MALIDHIFRCNQKDLTSFRPFLTDDTTIVGWVRADRVEHLAAYPDVFALSKIAVALQPSLDTPEKRTAALAEVAQDLAAKGHIRRLRNELYACKPLWAAPEQFRIDRGAVPFFGLKAYGVHVNGWRREAGQTLLWIGRRAQDKAIEPGKLDNMVAGGQPAELSLFDNVIKEAAEEASIPPVLAVTARPVGSISYCMEQDAGLKPDTLFCYDLEVPTDFTPQSADGEMESFELWPVERALEVIAQGNDFKFNVALVIIDFALRHGILSPDNEPAYEALIAGLHYPHPQ